MSIRFPKHMQAISFGAAKEVMNALSDVTALTYPG
jgi:hypothetical protein